MKLQDALFNWLQIKIVSDARPEDRAAQDTALFFEQILREDHALTDFEIEAADETMVHVRYTSDGKTKKQMFPKEMAEMLLSDIESNPKYNEQ